ncbi:MAG: histidine utilization repressor [Desulfobacterales bacterium]|jgi:GntR family histidine utilization transcriptional repressor
MNKKSLDNTLPITFNESIDPISRRHIVGSKYNRSGETLSAPYQKIKSHIIARIETGEWKPEARIPSEYQIAKSFGVSRGTANRALRELTSEGYLVGLQGVGRFVAKTKQHSPLLEVKPISQEIAERGETHSSRVHLLAQESTTSELAMTLGLNVGLPVYRSIIVHSANGRPVQLADRYVNPLFAPDYLEQDFTRLTPSEYLFQLGPLTEVEHIVEAVLPDSDSRKLLGIDANEPCLLIHRRTWSNDIIVTKANLLYPGSGFRLGGRFKPRSPAKPLAA